ncbi:hypothetical protein SDC9_165288 [bioreactor metagenome]|uniref:Uncharacterized protein n=1 Tax=bioreactor metagenome TaxID=1076179 RepID=A0A645FTY4_9ZZZZ
MDFGVNIQRRKQRVKRTSGSMQHKCIVQTFMRTEPRLTANMVILFVDLRGLRESGLLFEYRLGDKDPRIVSIELQ